MIDVLGATVGWRDLLDIALVAFLLYHLILLIKGTRAVSVLLGLVAVLLVYFASEQFGLVTLNRLLSNFLGSLFLVVIIIFQQDIRRGLSQLGAGTLWGRPAQGDATIDAITGAALSLAQKRVGMIVVIERGVPLGDFTRRAVQVQGKVSKELLCTIFHPGTPLHDGAVVVRGDSLEAAGCILPLSGRFGSEQGFGTRHRAALGITEETDALAVVVSEERGSIAVTVNGRMTTQLDAARLKRVLTRALEKKA